MALSHRDTAASLRRVAIAIAFVAALLALSIPVLASTPTAGATTCETRDDDAGTGGGSGSGGIGGGGGCVAGCQLNARLLWTAHDFPGPAIWLYYGIACTSSGGDWVEYYINPYGSWPLMADYRYWDWS